MNKRLDTNVAYDLEKRLSESVDRFRQSAERSAKVKTAIAKLHKHRQGLPEYPQEVVDWFREAEENNEEGEEE